RRSRGDATYAPVDSCRRSSGSEGPMSTSYEQFCPVARTLDVIGERWTILILRDLLLEGPRKFHQLQRSLTGVSPNTLSARLKRLEEYGVIAHRFYEQHPPRAEYLLTDKGRA